MTEVNNTIEDTFMSTIVHLDNNCKQVDDIDEVCLKISDSHNCDNVVNNALDKVDEFCLLNDDDKSKWFSNQYAMRLFTPILHIFSCQFFSVNMVGSM